MGGGVWAFRSGVAFDVASRFNACICSSSWLSEYRFCSWTVGERLTFWYPWLICLGTCKGVLCAGDSCGVRPPLLLKVPTAVTVVGAVTVVEVEDGETLT